MLFLFNFHSFFLMGLDLCAGNPHVFRSRFLFVYSTTLSTVDYCLFVSSCLFNNFQTIARLNCLLGVLQYQVCLFLTSNRCLN